MISRVRALLLLVIVALVGTTGLTFARQAPAGAATAALTATIPLDAQTTTGTFSNGLRYFIRANKKPEKRAELRLVVNAGSLLEENDQLGLAHFVEHMAFNGTKNYPKQDLVKFLESLGMRFGADVNAATSFDETTFMLQVPTDSPDVLDKSMLILEDWAHNVSFDDDEIDKERNVINEEWRLGRGAGARMQDKQLPILLKDSRYAIRLPIGTMNVIQTFKHDRLRAYYHDWYRPDLMAVVAVGDFDKAAVEALVKQHFASIPAATSPKARTSYPVPDTPGTLFAMATDKEMPATSVAVYSKFLLRDPSTIGAYRQQIVESLFSGMLSARFQEMAQKPDAPFIFAGAGRGLFVRTEEASILQAGVKEGGIARGLDALFTETARVVKFGFTATELDRQKQSILRAFERQVAEKDNQVSGNLADELVRHYTNKEPAPGIVYEAALQQRFLPQITLAEINALAKDWSPDRNRVVMVNAPEKAGVALPTEAALASVMSSAMAKPLTAYVDAVDSAPFFEATPTPGAVVKTGTKAALGLTEWELANGVTVVLKPTTFKEDEIVFRATSPGGTSLASDADYIPASSATALIVSSGLGKLSAIDLRKALTGKVASATPIIGELEEGLSGSASKKDLETMFQLIYMRFTAPRADPAIFTAMTEQQKAVLANQAAQPEYLFYTTLNSILTQDHPRARPMTPEMVGQMNLDKSLAFYKDRFSDASDFTFTFVGSFDVATMKPLVEKYLGSLPATHRHESWKDIGMRTPTGVIQKSVEKGIEPKSEAAIVFSGPFAYNQEQRIAIRWMANVLENRLRETLREDLGGTYSVTVSASYENRPRTEFQVEIDFGCDPTRTNDLIKTTFTEIEKLKASGPTDKEVADTRETFLREWETNTKQNGFWLSQIYLKYQSGENPETLLAIPDFYKRMGAAEIKKAAIDYLTLNNYVQVALFPEKK